MTLAETLLRRLTPRPEAEAVIEELASQEGRLYPFHLKNFPAGVRFEEADRELQREILMAMLAWQERHPPVYPRIEMPKAARMRWKMQEAFDHMLKRKLPLTEQDIAALMNWSARLAVAGGYYKAPPRMIKILSDYLKDHPLSAELKEATGELIKAISAMDTNTERLQWIQQLKDLTGDTQVDLPLTPGDVWAITAIEE
ncbi:MAG: hypothetical protein ACM3QS_12615, partial [Bacteroidota bacterium]